MADSGKVLLEVDDAGVALLTINCPDTRNAWDPELERCFYDVLAECDSNPRIRAAVLTGAGKTFCPGVGVGRLDSVAGTGVDFSGRIAFNRTLAFRKILIAAINGGCAGAGFAQAMMCDVRFASGRAKFATSFSRRGLPAEHGLSWLLPRAIGLERAMDLLLSGRTFDAAEALALGVVSRVTDPDDLLPAALAYARDIAANCAPTAVAVIKHQVLTDLDSGGAAAAQRGYKTTVAMSRGQDFREAIDALREQRPPAFDGLEESFSAGAMTGLPLTLADVDPSHAE